MLNSADGFATPQNLNNAFGPHMLYLGFLPKTVAATNNYQGWRANGTDIFFFNCDANPNSYFAFFPQKNVGQMALGEGTNFQISETWRNIVNGLNPVGFVST